MWSWWNERKLDKKTQRNKENKRCLGRAKKRKDDIAATRRHRSEAPAPDNVRSASIGGCVFFSFSKKETATTFLVSRHPAMVIASDRVSNLVVARYFRSLSVRSTAIDRDDSVSCFAISIRCVPLAALQKKQNPSKNTAKCTQRPLTRLFFPPKATRSQDWFLF